MKTLMRYRLDDVKPLEDRLALSTMSAITSGPVLHPVVTVTKQGSVRPLSESKSSHQLVFSDQVVSQGPGTVANDTSALIKVTYQNKSTTPITSATILEKLGPNLTYLYGGQVPSGGSVSGSVAANGTQSIQLNLPDGIAPGQEGSWEFQVEAWKI